MPRSVISSHGSPPIIHILLQGLNVFRQIRKSRYLFNSLLENANWGSSPDHTSWAKMDAPPTRHNPDPKRCTYNDLESPNDIRLLYLDLQPHDEELRGELKHVSLDENPPYAAISYVWGQPIFNHRLYTSTGDYYTIKQSLWQTFRDIRTAHEDDDSVVTILWADSVLRKPGRHA